MPTGHRLQLRPLRAQDRTAFRRILGDPAVHGSLRLDCDPTDDAFDRMFEERRAETIEGRPSRLAVLTADDGRFVGSIGAYEIAPTAIGLSYWIDSGHHGRGYGREAIGIFSEWALKAYGRPRIQANVAALNGASIRALSAAGYQPVEEGEDPAFGKAADRLFFVWPAMPSGSVESA